MSLFSRFRESLWGFVSPRKTQQRREKPFKAPPPSSKIARLHKREGSPVVPTVDHKLARYDSPIDTQSEPLTDLDPISPTISGKRALSDVGELEGDTLIHGEEELEEDNEATLIDLTGEEISNPKIIKHEDNEYKDYEKDIDDPSYQLEGYRRKGDKLLALHLSQEAVDVFIKIGMRGFEPLMPLTWDPDFDSFPTNLFSRHDDRTYIKAVGNNEFRAMKALRDLVNLGARARDVLISPVARRTPEQVLRQGIQRYIKWSLEDAGLNITKGPDIPNLVVESGDKNVKGAVLEAGIMDQLSRLETRWDDALLIDIVDEKDRLVDNEYLCDPPTMYGIVLTHTVMAFVALVPGQEGLKQIATLDYGDARYDVWNALAAAIYIIHCRNRLMELREVRRVEYGDNYGVVMRKKSEDPDA